MQRGFGYNRPMTSREPAAPASGGPSGTTAGRPSDTPAGWSSVADAPEVVAVDEPFDADRLYTLRATLSAHASRMGAAAPLVDRLLIVASELATNAVRHGGGQGRLRLWQVGGTLRCQVSDHGPGFSDAGVGQSPPGPAATGGRGMWICRQLSDDLLITNSEHGATVTVVLSPPDGAGGGDGDGSAG